MRIPLLDTRDFVFPGPTGLCSYSAPHAGEPASVQIPGPGKSVVRIANSDGDRVIVSVDGVLIAEIDAIAAIEDNGLRSWMIDNYFAVLRAGAEHRAAATKQALTAFGSRS